MNDYIQDFILSTGLDLNTVLVAAVFSGSLLVFFGFVSLLRAPNPAAARLAASAPAARRAARQNRGLLRPVDSTPNGLMRSFIPESEKGRSKLQRQLAQAGMAQSGALEKFTLIRIVLCVLLSGAFVALIAASKVPGLSQHVGLLAQMPSLTNSTIILSLTFMIMIGFYGPLVWLNSRAKQRRMRIEEGFPNALDLMQVSVEAGLGFDAAMTRVGNELVNASPDIAFEFLSVQAQIQAGRSRDEALIDMADRIGVDTVRSFAKVVQQSMQFGTSMASALTTYSNELRRHRELRAEEMANKLPVKMSAVLASLMLPALIMITIGPVVIRYIRLYSG